MVILVETFPSSVRQLPGGAVSSTIQGQTDRSQNTMQPIYCQQAVLQFPRINHYVCDRNHSFHIYNKTCCKDFSHDFSLGSDCCCCCCCQGCWLFVIFLFALFIFYFSFWHLMTTLMLIFSLEGNFILLDLIQNFICNWIRWNSGELNEVNHNLQSMRGFFFSHAHPVLWLVQFAGRISSATEMWHIEQHVNVSAIVILVQLDGGVALTLQHAVWPWHAAFTFLELSLPVFVSQKTSTHSPGTIAHRYV